MFITRRAWRLKLSWQSIFLIEDKIFIGKRPPAYGGFCFQDVRCAHFCCQSFLKNGSERVERRNPSAGTTALSQGRGISIK